MSYLHLFHDTTTMPATGLSGDAQLITPHGAKRAENVRPGDMIATRTRGLRPVRLVWTCRLQAPDMRADPARMPVRLQPRAVGPGMPTRPLILGPDHRVLAPAWMLDGAEGPGLLSARALADGGDAAWLDPDAADATLYNLVFDRHEIVLASGLPVETFHPSAAAVAGVDVDTRHALIRQFPALRGQRDAFPALPLPVAGVEAYLPGR